MEQVEAACAELAAVVPGRGTGLRAGPRGRRLPLPDPPGAGPLRGALRQEGVSSRLSAAALESLAIVAYRQPVSRAQIAALRGVNVDGVVRLLEQRGYIAAVGQAPGPGPGRALRHHRRLPGAAGARPPRPAAAGRGPAARARSPGRPGGAAAPGRRWLTGRPRHHPPGSRARASGCRRCWPGSGSGPAGPARS